MKYKILVGYGDNGSGREYACFYNSTTEKVFGCLLDDLAEAEEFQEFVGEGLEELNIEEFENKLKIFREQNGK